MAAYYNEIDPFAAAWLRELIKAGYIAPGDVDERDIRDIEPIDLVGYRQCHFFAGIGVWSYALRLAGWSDDQLVWTGSCPCQPFSAAGKGGGFDDERHLWPYWHHLISVCRPPVIIGEQVASKDGLGWLDLVQADLEGTGYASGAVDLCAAGVGAPHIRQRLWFVAERLADASGARLSQRVSDGRVQREARRAPEGQASELRGDTGRMADAEREPCKWGAGGISGTQAPECCAREFDGNIANRYSGGGEDMHPGPTNGFWRAADWLLCRDGKFRPVEPGTFPLAHGAAARVGGLRGFGNAINAEAAKAFIGAYLDAT